MPHLVEPSLVFSSLRGEEYASPYEVVIMFS